MYLIIFMKNSLNFDYNMSGFNFNSFNIIYIRFKDEFTNVDQ